MQQLLAGDRVRLKRDVERFPYCIVPAGHEGTVIEAHYESSRPTFVSVDLDVKHTGLEEWDNQLHWNRDWTIPDLELDLEVIGDVRGNAPRDQLWAVWYKHTDFSDPWYHEVHDTLSSAYESAKKLIKDDNAMADLTGAPHTLDVVITSLSAGASVYVQRGVKPDTKEV